MFSVNLIVYNSFNTLIWASLKDFLHLTWDFSINESLYSKDSKSDKVKLISWDNPLTLWMNLPSSVNKQYNLGAKNIPFLQTFSNFNLPKTLEFTKWSGNGLST